MDTSAPSVVYSKGKGLSQMELIHRSPVAASPGSEADTEGARVLAALLARVQRSLRRRVREMMPGPALPPSHVEVLRLLQRQPGLRVREVAATLRLAPNTTSTIVQHLVRLGYVARSVDERDRRVARLELTAAAHTRMDLWRDTRVVTLAEALGALAAPDREVVEAALPALARLADRLEVPRP
jgi:DNA-binding MarR family transcriptional regulator